MALGFLMGVALAIGVAINLKVGAVPLLVAIGLGKLSFLAAGGVMAAGAMVRRLGIRNERRQRDMLASGATDR
jgi:hypothetical protein